jgi:hypothetical protein
MDELSLVINIPPIVSMEAELQVRAGEGRECVESKGACWGLPAALLAAWLCGTRLGWALGCSCSSSWPRVHTARRA